MDMLPPFPGFRPEAFEFLAALEKNNRRDWFKPRKQTFDDEIQWPMRCLVVDVAGRAAAEGIPLRADPKKALFRIYRDTRFSGNKDPYKTALGATITRSGTHRDAGGVYVHLKPGESFIAAGFWHPESKLLRRWREKMVAQPESFLGMMHDLERHELPLDTHDDMLKRLPRGFERIDDEELVPYLRHKSFTVSRAVKDRELQSPKFSESVLGFTRAVLPLLRWGWAVEDGAAAA